MGNAQTREQRPPPPNHFANPHPAPQNLYAAADGTMYLARPARPVHGNIFGRSAAVREEPQDEAALAQRRLNRTEREARKKEEKEAARRKERDRSMREESVDGGFLVSSGLYISDEDYNKNIVRQLMVERRLAPFYFGLEDHREDWTPHQLIAAVHGSDIPSADHVPEVTPHWPPADGPLLSSSQPSSPSAGRTSFAAGETEVQPTSASSTPLASPGLPRGHSKTSSSIKIPTLGQGNQELSQLETNLPPQPLHDGQRLEIFLYKSPVECEICYRSFPTYCNRSRCCDKPICSECFVSIKRKDPHPVEHDGDDSTPNPQPRPAEPQNPESEFDLSEIDLVTEPARCPFCKEDEFGVTYEPPPFRTGIVRSTGESAMSRSNTTPSVANSPPAVGRRRAASIPANAPAVVTTDKIRPDWAKKLLQAKLNVAKRARAATALHQQAFLSGPPRSRLGLFRRGNSDSPNDSEEAGGNEGTPLDINRLIAAADRRLAIEGQTPIAGPRGASRGYQMSIEAQYEEALQRALRESVEDEQRRAEKAERERQEEERQKAKGKAKDDKQKAKEAAKLQKANEKAAKKAASGSSSFLSFPRAMRSTTSIVSSGRRSSGSIDSGKGKALARDSSNASLGVSFPSSSQAYLAAPGRSKEGSRPSTSRATPPSNPRDTRSSSQTSLALRSQSQTNFSSLNAMVGKRKETGGGSGGGGEGSLADEGSGLGTFASDVMSSMDDIMAGSDEQKASKSEKPMLDKSDAGSFGRSKATPSSIEPKGHEVGISDRHVTRGYGSV